MVVKCLPIRGIRMMNAKVKYIGNLNVKNHQKLESIEMGFHGLTGIVASFFPQVAFSAAAEKVHKSKIVGRPIEITAWHIIMRAPAEADFDEEEKRKIVAEILEEFGNPTASFGWHNHANKASDLHLIILNQDEDGYALKGDLSPRMRLKLIAIMDRIHDEINAQRKSEGRPLIETMQEARRRIANEKGIKLLAPMMAERARQEGLSDWRQIKPCIAKWIAEAGHKVTRNSDDTLSVKYQGTNKAKRHRWDYLQRDVMAIMATGSLQQSKVSAPTMPPVKTLSNKKGINIIGPVTKILAHSVSESAAIPAKADIPSPKEIGINPPPLTTADLEGSPRFKQLLELGRTPAQAIEIIKQDHEKKHALKRIDEEELHHVARQQAEEKADKERLEAERQKKSAINKGIIQGLLHIVESTENAKKQSNNKKEKRADEEDEKGI